MNPRQFTDDTNAWLVYSRAMSATPLSLKDADFEAWRFEQRFEVRRKAGRSRAASSERFSRPAGTPRPLPQPMPILFLVFIGMGIGLLGLAVLGAYSLIKAVLS